MNTEEQLKIIRDKFLAGKAAVEIGEQNTLFDQFAARLQQVYEEDLFREEGSLSIPVKEIFEAAVRSNFSKELMTVIPPDVFFNFGYYLTEHNQDIDLIRSYLDHFRYSEFLQKIYNDKRWEKIIEDLVRISNYNLGTLFERRKSEYGNKALFTVIQGDNLRSYSWNESGKIVSDLSAALIQLLQSENELGKKVAFLMENDVYTALIDLACLTSGIVNVLIPANSVPEHIEFILNQTESPVLIAFDEKQLLKIKNVKNQLSYLKKIVLYKGTSTDEMVIPFSEFLRKGKELDETDIAVYKKMLGIDDLATIMYTSGTTGEPKGIMFSNMNIVYKRFCRAMAIPLISDNDKYLAYLPLYHTFGRWLEMTGAIFWGAEYAFMENPSVETMLHNMQLVNPSIFISIPKKWIQIYEAITTKVDIEIDDEEKIFETVHQLTGGNLKWGLSAAGFLPPDIFRFFQRNKIELMSGFGMTEATGGITMTPPGEYIPNSLGRALPGIEIRIADDGELLIKGAYVMLGYFAQSKEETFVDNEWVPTGDVMVVDNNGFIEIIDRKKEIYKNIKGETIAPQRIENFFRDFESVKQVFLVGDHRPFNTVLIYPNFDSENNLLRRMTREQRHSYFSSVIVTVNNFLAPFERIVDYRLTDRSFAEEHGELTPKGTYKRRVIEKNFDVLIEQMYAKAHTSLFIDGVEVRIPNWFLREKSALSGDIIKTEEGISIPNAKSNLKISFPLGDKSLVRIGSLIYKINSHYIDFQSLLITPLEWLGNEELIEFTGSSIFQWHRQHTGEEKLQYHAPAAPFKDEQDFLTQLNEILNGGEYSLHGLNLAATLLQSERLSDSQKAVEYFHMLLDVETLEVSRHALSILYRPNLSFHLDIRREMFKTCLKVVHGASFRELLETYLGHDYDILNENVNDSIVALSHGAENLESIEKVVAKLIKECDCNQIEQTPVPFLFNLLSNYGINHPTVFKQIRQTVLHYKVNTEFKELWAIADQTQFNLRSGFRNWLGANQNVAVDLETGEEYYWNDVLAFEPDIDFEDKQRIKKAITVSPVLREAVFLFSNGIIVTLNNILPGGVWISRLYETNTRKVFRISIQTRFQGAFDILLKINRNVPRQTMMEEFGWLIAAGSGIAGTKIVDDFGGYWEEHEIWTEEFVSGDNVEKLIQRELKKRKPGDENRPHYLWPFFVWNAASVYYSFWKMTGYRYQIARPVPSDIIVPAHDYQTGSRLISVEDRIESSLFSEFILSFKNFFIKYCEVKYKFPSLDTIWNFVFAGILEAEGTEKGIDTLLRLKEELSASTEHESIARSVDVFIKHVSDAGFQPQQLYFSIQRFHRWYELNKDASVSAQAEMLYELYETYHMYNLEETHPETRTQFFLETAFFDSEAEIKKELTEIVRKQRNNEIQKEELLRHISNIQNEFELSDKERFFLTRLSYPHLKPTDTAILLKTQPQSKSAANLVVHMLDDDGNPFIIRNPISPKEISKLHQLFIETNLIVNFKPEHEFLVALSERGFIIGGLYFYRSAEETIHMEKIVVSNRYRRKGISEGLMNEMFNRMRDEHIKFVTTGFFRPEYFYRFGFKVERKYSGLVKEL